MFDTTHGTVRLTSAAKRSGTTRTARLSGETQTARLSAGKFKVTQTSRGLTKATLLRRRAHDCLSRVWVAGKGHLGTRGRFATATTTGRARWLTEDRCDGTLTKVTRGRVVVRDLVRKKRVVLDASESYLAHAK